MSTSSWYSFYVAIAAAIFLHCSTVQGNFSEISDSQIVTDGNGTNRSDVTEIPSPRNDSRTPYQIILNEVVLDDGNGTDGNGTAWDVDLGIDVGNETNNATRPKKISEGHMIALLFDLAFTKLTDYAHEAKFYQDLKKNGTDLEQLAKNETAANATRQEYRRRYFRRYGYDDDGYYRGGGHHIIPIPIFMRGYGGFGGFGGGGYGGHGYGFGGGGYRTGMLFSSMPSVADRVTKKNGFGSSFGYSGYGKHNFGGNYGTSYGGYKGYGFQNNLNVRTAANPGGPKYGWNIPPSGGTNNLNVGGSGAGKPSTNIGWNVRPQSGTGSNTGRVSKPGWTRPGSSSSSGSSWSWGKSSGWGGGRRGGGGRIGGGGRRG